MLPARPVSPATAKPSAASRKRSLFIAATVTAPLASTLEPSPIEAIVVSTTTASAPAPPTAASPLTATAPATSTNCELLVAATMTPVVVWFAAALAVTAASCPMEAWTVPVSTTGVIAPPMALVPLADPSTATLMNWFEAAARTAMDPPVSVVLSLASEATVAAAPSRSTVVTSEPPTACSPATATAPAMLRFVSALVAPTVMAPPPTLIVEPAATDAVELTPSTTAPTIPTSPVSSASAALAWNSPTSWEAIDEMVTAPPPVMDEYTPG